MGTRIRIMYIVFFSIFLLGSVIALTTLTDSIKIEKVNDKYIFWEKANVYSIDETTKILDSKVKELEELKRTKDYLADFYDGCKLVCIDGCYYYDELYEREKVVSHEPLDSCILRCDGECDYYKNWEEQIVPDKITKLQKEIAGISGALK